MSARNRVYVARKDCGCIVAAFPIGMDKTVKGELLKQLAKAGLDIEQATDLDVQLNFRLVCDHNRPPLLAYMDQAKPADDNGIDAADVDAAGTDLDPEAEEALEQIEAEEENAEVDPSPEGEVEDAGAEYLEDLAAEMVEDDEAPF